MTTDEIITGILAREGSEFTDDPVDAGGPTKYGITLRTLRAYRGDDTLTAADVKALTEAEAREVYAKRYIHDTGFDQILDPWTRAFVVDMGVLQGPRAATLLLQRALRTVAVDGVFGDETLAAVNRAPMNGLKKNLITLRLQHLLACALADVPRDVIDRTDLKFLKGWINRVATFL
jgi:lysozyme family protein